MKRDMKIQSTASKSVQNQDEHESHKFISFDKNMTIVSMFYHKVGY